MNRRIADVGLQLGVLHLTCLHTSASLTINENADPRVLNDLAGWMEAVVPQDGFGPLTAQTMTVSVKDGRLLLGTWQAIDLWEHRAMPQRRQIACHLMGD